MATYDSKETDELMTKQLAEREDFGVGVFPHHDYPEESNTVKPWSPARHQQELWNRFREWWTNTFKKKVQEDKAKVGKEEGKNSPNAGEQVGPGGEGFWSYKNTPYVAPTQSPAFFMAMPAMKIGSKDDIGLTLESLKEYFIEKASMVKEANTDQYGDHHISMTFEFMPDQIKVECNWDAKDLPANVSEVQALSRIVTFLEKRLPEAFLKFKHARAEDVDLPNRSVTMVIPKGER